MTPECFNWIGIMRHGEAFRPHMDPDRRTPANNALTVEGWRAAMAVADRLADTLTEHGLAPVETLVLCAPTGAAIATARELTTRLSADEAVPLAELDPKEWPSDASLSCKWKATGEKASNREVVIVVGHDPRMSWLLHDIVTHHRAGQVGAGPLLLRRGELAMLAPTPKGKKQLEFILSPSDEALVGELQAKIKSKMESAKLLGAFVTALLIFAGRETSALRNAGGWPPAVAAGAIVRGIGPSRPDRTSLGVRDPVPAFPDHAPDACRPDAASTRATRTLNTVRSVRLSMSNSCSVPRNGCWLTWGGPRKASLTSGAWPVRQPPSRPRHCSSRPAWPCR